MQAFCCLTTQLVFFYYHADTATDFLFTCDSSPPLPFFILHLSRPLCLQWNSGISLEPWAQWQCWPRRALRSIAVASRTRRLQVHPSVNYIPYHTIITPREKGSHLTSHLLAQEIRPVYFYFLSYLSLYWFLALYAIVLFPLTIIPISLPPSLPSSLPYLSLSLRGQAVSRRMRPTSPPTWRPSLRCRRRGHQGRRLGSRFQHGGARSGPSKPRSSPRSVTT